jgi:hypothetical protein
MAGAFDRLNAPTVAKAKSDPYFGAKTKEVTLPSGEKVQAIDIGTAKPPAATKVGMVSPISGLTITGTERNASKEAEAMKIGYTKEYIASRGGINAMGYFNDTPTSGQLNAAEYKSVTKADGTINTAAMAEILQNKKREELKGSGLSATEIETRLANEWSTLYAPAKSAGYNADGKPEEGGQYSASGDYVGATGGTTGTGAPAGGITGGATNPAGKTLAQDAFINTFKTIVGQTEGSKAYVGELYKYISKFWKSGSTIEEAINLALRDAKNDKAIPEFTNRFAAIFKLEDMKAAGKIVNIPTVAEYVASEEKLADVLTKSNLADLANQAFISTVLSTGKSVSETTDIITNVFDTIDNAPAEWKAQVAKALPFADRATLAKAILTGPEGVKQLERTVATAGVQAAAGMQGLTLGTEAAGQLVSKGQTFATSGARFGQVARLLPTAQKLSSIETGIAGEQAYTQQQAISATFDQSAAELKKLEELAAREEARFLKRSGTIGSKSFASQARGSGLI